MALPPSPKQLQRHIRDLEAFREAYEPYARGEAGDRARIIARIPGAQRALDAAELNLVVADPPMLGPHRQTYAGLVNTAFLDERPGFALAAASGAGISETLLETVEQAIAKLRDQRDLEQRRRRNPLYWLDRLVRGLLLVPAYLVGAVIGQPARVIDRSVWGLPLRVLAVLADTLAIVYGGQQLGIW